jgi:hypothetical protein
LGPLDSFDDAVLELSRALVQLFKVLSGDSHGIFQGTHEAALFEAQGGQIGPGGFDHLNSLRQTAAAIQARQTEVNQALNKLQMFNGPIATRLKTICEPIIKQSGEYLQTAKRTTDAAASLRSTDPTRFEGVILGEGGLGPEIGRSWQSLVTNQLNRMSVQLVGRGIEPRLIPAARASLQSVLVAIRNLPTETKDAAAKVSATLVSMRMALQITVRQAMTAARVELVAAASAIDAALIAMSSKFSSGLVIIPSGFLDQFRSSGPVV